MHDDQTVQRFIELRAAGSTYARIISELDVSKTLPVHRSRTGPADYDPGGSRFVASFQGRPGLHW
jgi:hypothetical protein